MRILLIILLMPLSITGITQANSKDHQQKSGLSIGAESPAFDPQHAWGPDKGSHACPMCKYGYHPGVMYFLNTDENWEDVKKILIRLEKESVIRKNEKFKAYLIYTNPAKLSTIEMEEKLAGLGKELNIHNMALTYVPSVNDKRSSVYLHKINPLSKNTIIVFNLRKVRDKFINFVPSDNNFATLFKAVDAAGKIR